MFNEFLCFNIFIILFATFIIFVLKLINKVEVIAMK